MQPFIKWTGGKRQLLSPIFERLGLLPEGLRYIDPFLGGGAVPFEMARRDQFENTWPLLADANEHLVNVYRQVQKRPQGLVELLEQHQAKHGRDHYYAVRENMPRHALDRAARFVYLNKTCFNGLYRVNKSGKFNVPMGDYKRPTIVDPIALQGASEALQRCRIKCQDWTVTLGEANRGDMVYLDPPYWPVSKTANFTAYTAEGFGEKDQAKLARCMDDLTDRGVYVLASNADVPPVRELYAPYTQDTVLARRNGNSKGAKRGAVPELLIHNFDQVGGLR